MKRRLLIQKRGRPRLLKSGTAAGCFSVTHSSGGFVRRDGLQEIGYSIALIANARRLVTQGTEDAPTVGHGAVIGEQNATDPGTPAELMT